MERKVNFPDQSFDIAVDHPSAITTSPDAKDCDLLNQLLQVIRDKATGNLHNSKRTVTRLSNMTDTQDIRVQLLKSLTQLVRWWWFEVGRERIAVGHRGGEKSEKRCDVLRRSIQFPQESSKVLEPGCFV